MINLTTVRTKISKPKNIFLLLMVAWFLVNLLQALFMEVISDEAYYGMYGKFLDWGYYDHPPMIALLIRISSLIFSGNLGIRFMTVIMQMGTILLIWKIIDIKKPEVSVIISFFIIAGSISMFSVYGVITTPDAPLLFFTALFLFALKKFQENQKWTITLLLALSMSGLVYSKYQAVLVIGFAILSNLRILRFFKFWLAGILALSILAPHICWQISNNFPSFQYHLVDRSDPFDWIYLIEYLPNQMAVFNPLILGAAIYIIVKYKPAGLFERSLYFQIIGFIAFFWLICFRGHVEPHWTVACSIPMIILITQKSCENLKLYNFIRKYVLPSILLLLILRVFLMIDSPFNRYLGYSGKEVKYKNFESAAGDLPIIFTGSFQRPSLYPFFTGKEATVISSVYSRQTQFDIWQFERKYNNKPAFICLPNDGKSKVYGIGKSSFSGFRTDSLQTVNRMKILYDLPQTSFRSGDSLKGSLIIKNVYDYDINFNHKEFPVSVCLVLLKGEEVFVETVSLSEPVGIISAGDTVQRRISVTIPDVEAGEYPACYSLNTIFGPSLNSHFMKIKIVNDD